MNWVNKFSFEIKLRLAIVPVVLSVLTINFLNAQALSSAFAFGSSSTSSSVFSTVGGASVTLDATGINSILVVSSFELSMVSTGNDQREGFIRLSDNADPENINSGVFTRGLSAAKSTDHGIGSIVYIFDVSAISGNRTYSLQHGFSSPSRTLTTSGTIIAIGLSDASGDLQNSSKRLGAPVTMTDAFSSITGMETDVITTSDIGGFYVSASIESLTTMFNTSSVAEWKLQYKFGAAGAWKDLSSTKTRSMSNTNDKGMIGIVGFLPDNSEVGNYYFRIAHRRSSVTSTIQTTNANIVAVALSSTLGQYPVLGSSATGISTTSSIMSNAASLSLTPTNATDIFLHAHYGMSGDAQIDDPTFDLYVDNSIFDGADQRRYLSSASDKGSGISVGLAKSFLSGTTYELSLRHASDDINTLTTNDILLTGFGLTPNSFSLALPIELLYFDAYIENKFVNLIWETATEKNNDYFTIERSLTGKEWEKIEIIGGAGNSFEAITYSTTDNNPFIGTSYYRLRQTDYDGSQSVSRIQSIYLNEPASVEVNLFPNPASETITIKTSENELRDFQIYDLHNRNITGYISIIMQNSNGITLDISGLENGLYILKIKNSTKRFHKINY